MVIQKSISILRKSLSTVQLYNHHWLDQNLYELWIYHSVGSILNEKINPMVSYVAFVWWILSGNYGFDLFLKQYTIKWHNQKNTRKQLSANSIDDTWRQKQHQTDVPRRWPVLCFELLEKTLDLALASHKAMSFWPKFWKQCIYE